MALYRLLRRAAALAAWRIEHAGFPEDAPEILVEAHRHWRDGGGCPATLPQAVVDHAAFVDLRDGSRNARYVWAGARLTALFGEDLTGRLVRDCYWGWVRREVLTAYATVMAGRVPQISTHRFRILGSRLGYWRLLLPLMTGDIPQYALLVIVPDSGVETARDWRRHLVRLDLAEAGDQG